MFTRTLSVGSVLEVRPSAGTASPCIRGNARLQISRLLSCGTHAGSWTSLRSFHSSLRDVSHCSVVHQYPGLLAVLEHPSVCVSSDEKAVVEIEPSKGEMELQQIAPAADIAEYVESPSKRDVQGNSASAANAVRDLFVARASRIAELARPPSHGLERRCVELHAENQQLKAGIEAVAARFQKVQDLNLRLCNELKQVRDLRDTERKVAVRHIAGLRHQMRRRGLRLRRLLRLRNCRRARAQPVEKARQEADLVPIEAKDDAVAEMGSAGCNEQCSCGDMHWSGCTQHRTYSNALLLAHRDTSLRISLGAPGLELPDSAQSLRCQQAGSRWQLLVLPKAQEQRRRVHWRRQEHLEEPMIPDRPPGL